MNETPLRIGIVGAGENTKLRHIPGLKAIKGVEIVSVCNRSLESGERVAKEFGISEVYKNWQELVRDKDIDAVVIGTWPYMHCPVTVAALEAGKHVMCEARMACNAKEAHRMLDAARICPNLSHRWCRRRLRCESIARYSGCLPKDLLARRWPLKFARAGYFSTQPPRCTGGRISITAA
jgi:hypothetical protein